MNQLAIWPILASNHLPYPNNALIHQLNSEVGMMTSTSNQAPALMDSRRMSLRVGLMTREYPPNVYGGAGVHVEYLSRELAKRIDVEVHCWGDQFLDEGNLHVRGAEPWSQITQGTQEKYKTALETLSLNLAQMKPLATIDIARGS